MKSELPGENCFICCEKPVNFHNSSVSELNICHIICQHFWFKEDDLQSAIVCRICWDKVDQFHQFYLDVQKLHGELDEASLSLFIKQEETEIEEDQLPENCIDLPLDDQKPFDIVHCKLEIPEECNELLTGESGQEPRKKRKYTRRPPPGERIAKQTKPSAKPRPRKRWNPEKQQAEDDFIKQHTSYSCEDCNMEFESFRAIKRHRVQIHNKYSIKCCGTQHRTRTILYQHVQKLLNPEAFKCEICGYTFKHHRGYLRHKRVNHTADRSNPRSHKLLTPAEQQTADDFIKQHTSYSCEDCNMEFESFRAIKLHRIKTHNKNFIVCCGTQYRTRAFLYQHVQNVLNPEAFKCEICGNTFKYHRGYLRHMKENHTATAKSEPTFTCHRCGKSFTKEVVLKVHVMGHETLENKTAKCEFCGKCFSHKRVLRIHVKTIHQRSNDFICEICSKGFHLRSTFLTHRKRHELKVEQQRKQCPVCNKWLTNLSYRRHFQLHIEDGKEYKCEMCAHVSINSMALKLHVSRKHAPDKKRYVCELCSKEYSSPTTLREHVANAHTKEPLYQCQYCEKKFFSNATMYSHRKKEHPQEWQERQLAKYTTEAGKAEGSGETVS